MIFVLMFSFFCVPTDTSYAKSADSTKTHTHFDKAKEKQVINLYRKTNISKEKLSEYLDFYSEDDIKNAYVLSFFETDDFEKILDEVFGYHNMEKLLIDKQINKEDFEKKFDSIFNNTEDMISRNNIPYRKVPPDK